MNSKSIILRRLREINKLTIKQAAKHINRGIGWLSEIENDRGAARINDNEFQRIVLAYGGDIYRKQFGAWVGCSHKKEIIVSSKISFEGSALKFIRKKSKTTLKVAASSIGISSCYLSYLEIGLRNLTPHLRNKLLVIYGFSPSSFKSFTAKDIEARNIPAHLKLEILLQRKHNIDIKKIFDFALSDINKITK